jgi:hypothetical protein
MRIGFGGGAFGVRAGISNRGIGGGIGPLSAGTSWRRSSGSGGLVGLLLGLAAILLVIFWPYLLGTYLAVEYLGAHDPSTLRSVVGWFFEAIWILGLLAMVTVRIWAPLVFDRRPPRGRPPVPPTR